MQRDSARFAHVLDTPEALLEFCVGAIERERRMYACLAAQIDAREQKIAELCFKKRMVRIECGGRTSREWRTMLQLLANFIELLLNLVGRTGDVRPVKADAGCAILKPVSAM